MSSHAWVDDLPDAPVNVCRNFSRGELFLIVSVGGPLSQGIVHNKRVTCPLHNFVIDLKSGVAIAPDEGFTRAHPAKVENGAVWLYVQTATAAVD